MIYWILISITMGAFGLWLNGIACTPLIELKMKVYYYLSFAIILGAGVVAGVGLR